LRAAVLIGAASIAGIVLGVAHKSGPIFH
jgi:hypothetical protein